MPVTTQKWITRADLQANPETLYLFGDNQARVGYGGQAREMRDEPNAVGVATKKDPGTFWSDNNFLANGISIINDLIPVLTHLLMGGNVVIPEDGLGTGLSELPTRAPRTAAYLEARLNDLKAL